MRVTRRTTTGSMSNRARIAITPAVPTKRRLAGRAFDSERPNTHRPTATRRLITRHVMPDGSKLTDQPRIRRARAEGTEPGVRSNTAISKGSSAGTEPRQVLLRRLVRVTVIAEVSQTFPARPLSDVDQVDRGRPVAVLRPAAGHLLVEGGQRSLSISAGEASSGQIGMPREDVSTTDSALVTGGSEAEEG